ncbi:MAG: SDR family oxidoreductase, partial [Spiribacter salinus]
MSADAGVLVTGSAGGVGQALVRAFSEAGYFVIGLDRGGTLGADYSIEFDLGRLAWDHGAFDVLTDALAVALEGKVFKVLVNNAAIQALGPVEDLSVTDFRATMDVNLVAAFALVKVALPHLETSGGAILNMGSIHGRLTKPNFSAYA